MKTSSKSEMDILTKTEQLADNKDVRYIDFHFLRLLKSIDPDVNDDLLLAALLVSNHCGKGDVCIDLQQQSERQQFANNSLEIIIESPTKEQWINSLKGSKLVSCDGSVAPLVLVDGNYLFLSRYWDYEVSLAQEVVQRAECEQQVDIEQLKDGVQKYFPQVDSCGDTDWQVVAAISAASNRFSVITGGPGTGKTTTVTKILALIAQQNLDQAGRIVLAAPTGKAANRLSESIKSAKLELSLEPDIAKQIPDEVKTLHRLLRASPGKASFFYNARNKLELDLLVVDEASMIDLAMMAKLMQALPKHAQVILLGDMNQLASVESGSVLADICAVGMRSSPSQKRLDFLQQQFDIKLPVEQEQLSTINPLGDSVVSLKKSYRFDSLSGIGALAAATNENRPDNFFAAFSDSKFSDISFHATDASSLQISIDKLDLTPYKNYLQSESAEQALQRLAKFQVLCPMRDGVFGVNNLNRLIQNRLLRTGLIQVAGNLFHGQPIMITENNYKVGLYNGDVGIIWRDAEQLKAYFPEPGGGVKRLLLAKLPAFETVFAMTVHKSQGSEFESVLIISADNYAEFLTRELLYTAITRARKTVAIWGNEMVIRKTITAKVNRNSLLQDRLLVQQKN